MKDSSKPRTYIVVGHCNGTASADGTSTSPVNHHNSFLVP